VILQLDSLLPTSLPVTLDPSIVPLASVHAERAAFLDLILRATQDGIVDWNLLTNEEHYNPRWTHLFGYDDEDLAQCPTEWRTLIHPDDAEEAQRLVQDHLEQDWPFVTTLRMRHRHGGYRTILCRGAAQRDAKRRPVRMVIIFSDINDRIELEQRQRALASALPDAVFRVSSSGEILELKPGNDHESSPFLHLRQGAALRECLPERIVRHFEAAFSAGSLDASSSRSLEFTTPTASAGALHHEARLVRSGDNEWVCIVRDVTGQHALADRLAQSQKLGAIGQLAAGVAHEINTPMQYISDNLHFAHSAVGDLLGFAKRIQSVVRNALPQAAALQELADAEAAADLDYVATELPRAIERSLDGVSRMTTIVRALKTFAHPGGREFTSVDLKSLLEATAAVATNEWKYVADLEVRIEDGLPPVTCAGGEISQVVLNLIVNGAHAITEKLGNSGAKGRIGVEARRAGDEVEILVSDTGAGIPEHARPRVFEPFFTTKEVGKGTGQGLALAHAAIVNHHKGSLHFETELGAGTTFVIKIPILGVTPDEN
jgi:PAS domain S-box-containing protein